MPGVATAGALGEKSGGAGVGSPSAGIPIGKQLRQVACGEAHIVAWSRDGRLFTYGDHSSGQLGHGDKEDQYLPKRVEGLQERVCNVAAGRCHSLSIGSSGALYSWGWGGKGRLGHGDEEDQLLPRRVEGLQERACSVAAGDFHSLAIGSSGTLYSWGTGVEGRLGHGDEAGRYLPTQVDGVAARVCAVTAGTDHSVAIATDGRAWGWGFGRDESLGLRLTEHQLEPLEYNRLLVARRRDRGKRIAPNHRNK